MSANASTGALLLEPDHPYTQAPYDAHTSTRTLLLEPAPELRKRAQEITCISQEILQLVEAMKEIMYGHDGIGLAANQIGALHRIFVCDLSAERDDCKVLINPRVVAWDGTSESEEGCLSLPDIKADVKRKANIEVEALDLDGNSRKYHAEGLFSACIQHEIDHLDGVLFLDRLSAIRRNLLLRKHRKAQKG